MEERGSERDLMRERFDRLLDYGWLVVEHGLKMRPNNLQHQHVMFPVYALYLEMIQESEDAIRSRVCP
jgi:hypothetical protein